MKKVVFILMVIALAAVVSSFKNNSVMMPPVLHPENTYQLTLTSTGETVEAHIMASIDMGEGITTRVDMATDAWFVYNSDMEMLSSSLSSEQVTNMRTALDCLCCECGCGFSCETGSYDGCPESVDHECAECPACAAKLGVWTWDGGQYVEGCDCKWGEERSMPCIEVVIY